MWPADSSKYSFIEAVMSICLTTVLLIADYNSIKYLG